MSKKLKFHLFFCFCLLTGLGLLSGIFDIFDTSRADLESASCIGRMQLTLLVVGVVAVVGSAVVSPTFTGMLGSPSNSMWFPARAASLSPTPNTTVWWPGVRGLPPYQSFPGDDVSSVVASSDGQVFTLSALADTVQSTRLSASGVAVIVQAAIAEHTTFAWLMTPLPMLLAPSPSGGLTLFYAFFGCVRNSNPQSCANVVLALDASASLSLLWLREFNVSDNANQARALIIAPDASRLILATVNNNEKSANVTSLDPLTGSSIGDVAPLPSSIAACGNMPPYVGRSLLFSPTPGDTTSILVISVGPNNGAPSFGSTCVYGVNAITGALTFAVPGTITWAPISTLGLGLATSPAVQLIVLTSGNAIGLTVNPTSATVTWNTSLPGGESVIHGAALGPYPGIANPYPVLFVSVAWGRSYVVSTIYAIDARTGAVIAQTAIPHYPDVGFGSGNLLTMQSNPFPESAVAVFVRATNSFADSAYAQIGTSADVAYSSIIKKLELSCSNGACSFSLLATFVGASVGTSAGGAMLPGPTGEQLVLVTPGGVQVIK